ncbi:DUF551 domain-containing protein [Cronobacter malonaticus]
MSTISNELVKDLRMAFSVWQQDYDPVEDKEQYDMFGLGVVAMDELLAQRKEREKAEYIVKAAEKLVRCKGRYHSEQNYRALAALFGVTTPDLPPLETDTTSEQFESRAGKAVVPISYLQGHKDGLEWAARLAEANHPQTSDWLYDDPLELAKAIRKGPDMPVSIVDGWIPCSERMPPENTGVLVATEFDGPGDWRMKWGTRVPGHPDAKNGWFVPGASWTPSHWQPLPEPPCK